MSNARRSVTGKLMAVILATTAIALLVTGIGLILTDVYHDRRSWGEDLATAGGILALASAPALSFNDHESADRNLAALRTRTAIRAAALYTTDRRLYAQYTAPGESAPPAQLPPLQAGLHFAGNRAEFVQPIVQAGEPIGNLYLRGRYQVGARLWAYTGILAVVLTVGLAAAMFAASWLQGLISEPMSSIANVARRIVEGREYSLRAAKTTDDEFGLVIDAFNNMLAQMQERTRDLERSNAALLAEAKVREAAQEALRTSEKLYRAIGESIDYGVWICDAEGHNVYASDSFLRLTGLTQQQCSRFGWTQVLHPEDRDATLHAWTACVRSGRLWYREHRVRGLDGQYHPILAQGVPIRDDAGHITRWAGINLDVERMKRTELALREADRRKDEFLATLAHELRNPLAPIRNAVQILESPAADERRRKWGRDVIARQVNHMALLLDDLLDVSRVTRGQFELRKDYVELKTVCDAAIETARPLLEAKQHSLSVSLPPSPLTLEADPLRLAQVISNLLTNAAKYTDPNGRITLSAMLDETELRIAVADSGIGLATATLPKLFTMFSQVNSAIDRAQGGLGIGLALVKGLVDLHGGTVEARSEGLGHGSEFVIHLPRRLVTQREVGGDPAARPISARTQRPMQILIADDNRDAADTLSATLGLRGCSVTAAYSGAEALEVGARDRPQVVILDVGMPGLDGYETARRIRLEAWGVRTVLVALTGWGQEQDRQRAAAAGFDEHLTKPVDPNRLYEILLERLEQQRGHAAQHGAAPRSLDSQTTGRAGPV